MLQPARHTRQASEYIRHPFTAKGRIAILEEQKQKALALMSYSSAQTPYKAGLQPGQRPTIIPRKQSLAYLAANNFFSLVDPKLFSK